MNKRHRRRLRPVQPDKPNQPVRMYAYMQDAPHWQNWTWKAVTFAVAESMVVSDEAERLTREHCGALVTIYKRKHPVLDSHHSPGSLTARVAEALAAAAFGDRLTASQCRLLVRCQADPHEGNANPAGVIRPRTTEAERRAYEAAFPAAVVPVKSPKMKRAA